MTLRLTVHGEAWWAHARGVVRSYGGGLRAVVKGNGYGFGRGLLHHYFDDLLAGTADAEVYVGTVYELGDAPAARPTVVLTPAAGGVPAGIDIADNIVLSVAAPEDVDRLPAGRAAVAIKLRSSMLRLGASPPAVAAILGRLADRSRPVHSLMLHLPKVGSADQRVGEIARWLAEIDALAAPGSSLTSTTPLSVSHLDPATFATLRASTDRPLTCRVGSALWHGDKAALELHADVIAVHPVAAGDRAGYQLTEVPGDGHLIVVGAGTAHGVTPLLDGRSPFHHARRRLAMLEPPHMHSTLCFADATQPIPEVGAWVDVQRPLIGVTVDETRWI